MRSHSIADVGPTIRRVARPTACRSGFTMTELLVASAVGTLVSVATLAAFAWSLKQASLCTRIAWSQNEAMRTSRQVEEFVRNATEIVACDVVEGRWVTLRLPDGSVGTLAYSNAIHQLRDGRLYLQTTNTAQLLVARGLTEVMGADGYTTPMFTVNARSNSVRVAYRVSEPTPSGARAANDEAYAAIARFAVCLRNVGY